MRYARALMVLWVMVGLAGVSPAEEPEYVGAKKCKVCHKKSGIYESWEASTHATA